MFLWVMMTWQTGSLQTSQDGLFGSVLCNSYLSSLGCLFFVLLHSHPSDLKHRFHRHQSSSSLHGPFNHNHVADTNLPLVAEELDEHLDNKGPVYDPKQDVFVSLFVSPRCLFCPATICFILAWQRVSLL